MSKLNRINGKKVIQKLKRAGFVETHQRGSHLYLKNADSSKIVTVSMHSSKDIPIGTIHNIVAK